MPLVWVDTARQRAQNRLAAARASLAPPPFTAGPGLDGTPVPVVVTEPAGAGAEQAAVPRGIRVAAAWAWRIVLFILAAYLIIRVIGMLSVVVIPVVVALLLAAMLQPIVATLRRHGVNRTLSAALVLVSGLIVVFGGLT